MSVLKNLFSLFSSLLKGRFKRRTKNTKPTAVVIFNIAPLKKQFCKNWLEVWGERAFLDFHRLLLLLFIEKIQRFNADTTKRCVDLYLHAIDKASDAKDRLFLKQHHIKIKNTGAWGTLTFQQQLSRISRRLMTKYRRSVFLFFDGSQILLNIKDLLQKSHGSAQNNSPHNIQSKSQTNAPVNIQSNEKGLLTALAFDHSVNPALYSEMVENIPWPALNNSANFLQYLQTNQVEITELPKSKSLCTTDDFLKLLDELRLQNDLFSHYALQKMASYFEKQNQINKTT